MIRAALVRALAALARLEPRHWVAVVGSTALHLGVLLGLLQAPPSLPPPLTFEVKLEPPPEAKRPRQHSVKPIKAHPVRKKPAKHQVREPHTLQAQWQGERKPAKDAPTLSLPNAKALGIAMIEASAVPSRLVSKVLLAKSVATAVATELATEATTGSALSEPGNAGAGAPGSDAGIALARSQRLEPALHEQSHAGASQENAGDSAAAVGKIAATGLSSAATGAIAATRPQGGEPVATESHATQGSLASGEPVRLSMSGTLSGLAAPLVASADPSPTGTQLSGANEHGATSAGATASTQLATVAASGDAQVNATTSRRGETGGAQTSATGSAVARGDAGSGNLATAASGQAAQGNTVGRKSTVTKGEFGEGSGGLAGAGDPVGEARLDGTSSKGGGLRGAATAGAGLGSNAAAALAPGEPGSVPRLAMAMATLPVILELGSGGAHSSFRAQGGGFGGAPSSPAHLNRAGTSTEPLRIAGAQSPAYSGDTHAASLASGGARPKDAGKLRGEVAVAVEQVRPDSQVKPLDVLAPSTYCPLPGHVRPDNRPRDTTQDITEKPAYGSDNPGFVFPLRAWAYGHQGRVTVRVQVLADGKPGQMWIKQSSGSGILDADAREQLARYHFKPARKNSQPVPAWIDVPVDYRLNAEKPN